MELENIELSKQTIKNSFVENKNIFLIFIALIISLAAAPELIKNNLFNSFFEIFADSSIMIRQSGNFIFVFLFSFVVYLLPIAFIYLSGLSVSGQTIAVLLTFLTGLAAGSFSAFFYIEYSSQGLIMCLSLFYLPMMISLIAVVLAAREAFVFSNMLVRAFKATSQPMNFSSDFKVYSLRFVFIICIVAVASVFSAILSFAFFDMFTY